MKRVRPILAAVLGIIAVIGVFASVTAIWTRDVLSDSSEIADAVNDALEDPVVINGLAVYLTDQIFIALDVESAVEETVPDRLGPLAPAIVGGAQSVVVSGFERLLSAEATSDVVAGIVERAHAALMKLLQGDGLVSGVTVSDGEVSVNLLPLMGRGFSAVQEVGLFTQVEIPTLEPSGDPEQQLADLEAAFGRDLPEDFGQLTVYESERLATAEQTIARAQDAVAAAKRGLVLTIVVTIACIAGCILLARRRRRAALVLALATAAVMVVARVLVSELIERLPRLVVQPAAREALRETTESLADGLLTLITLTVVLGIVIALVAYLTGDSEGARSLKVRVGAGRGSLRAAVDAHRDATALIAFVAGLAVLVFAGLGGWQVVLALLLAAAGGWAMLAPRPTETLSTGTEGPEAVDD